MNDNKMMKPRRPGRPRNPIPREKLLEIARAAFAEGGYVGTSMKVIAERAGIRKASLLHHFSSKQALYLEVLSGMVDDLGELISAADMDRGDHVDRLDRLGALVTEYLGAHPRAARLLLRELVASGPFLRGPGAQAVPITMAVTASFLEDGMKAGAFVRQDPRQLALSIAGLHLVYFATADIASELLGADVFTPDMLEQRAAELQAQVRRLCGVKG